MELRQLLLQETPSSPNTKFSGQVHVFPPFGARRHIVSQPPLFSHGLLSTATNQFDNSSLPLTICFSDEMLKEYRVQLVISCTARYHLLHISVS